MKKKGVTPSYSGYTINCADLNTNNQRMENMERLDHLQRRLLLTERRLILTERKLFFLSLFLAIFVLTFVGFVCYDIISPSLGSAAPLQCEREKMSGSSLGFILSGTYDESGGNTAELYQPGLGSPCNLPPLPQPRFWHTHDSSGLVCGGKGSSETCLQWRNYTWQTWHLEEGREDHSSWFTPDHSTVLMGGNPNRNTSEIVRSNGTTERHFTLEYPIE